MQKLIISPFPINVEAVSVWLEALYGRMVDLFTS